MMQFSRPTRLRMTAAVFPLRSRPIRTFSLATLTVVLLAGTLAGCQQKVSGSNQVPGASESSCTASNTGSVVAVGDIAASTGLDDLVAVAAAQQHPAKVLLLGDTAYPKGSQWDYEKYFNPDWSRFAACWIPIPGNHEYLTAGAAGYRARFDVPAGPLYSVSKVGAWRVIGLDSQYPQDPTQLAWLRNQLAANPGKPVLVMWHRPRYSSGTHGDQTDTSKLWNLVKADKDVKLVLWGHDHDYERMSVPVKGKSPITAMVVGTGGGTLRPTPQLRARSWRKFYADQVTGVLKLQLNAHSFTWSFIDVGGRTLDSGKRKF